jgi:ketosteroid isomerase-like protein
MQDNKALVHQLFDRFSQRDWDGAVALLSDDVSWQLPGKPERSPAAGIYDKARLRRLFQGMDERLETPLQMRVLGAISEGDQVAAEVESSGDLKNGRQYRQQYHFLMSVRAGKICNVREYLDTHHSFDVWFAQ